MSALLHAMAVRSATTDACVHIGAQRVIGRWGTVAGCARSAASDWLARPDYFVRISLSVRVMRRR
jgi:hypothetical protein